MTLCGSGMGAGLGKAVLLRVLTGITQWPSVGGCAGLENARWPCIQDCVLAEMARGLGSARTVHGSFWYGLSQHAVSGSSDLHLGSWPPPRACVPRDRQKLHRLWAFCGLALQVTSTIFYWLQLSERTTRFWGREIRCHFSMARWQGHIAEDKMGGNVVTIFGKWSLPQEQRVNIEYTWVQVLPLSLPNGTTLGKLHSLTELVYCPTKWDFQNTTSHGQMKLNGKIHTKSPGCSKCTNVLSLPFLGSIILQTMNLNDPYWTEGSTAILCLLHAYSWVISTLFSYLISPCFFHIFFNTPSPRMLTDGSLTTNQPTQTHPFPLNIVSNLVPV